jgi:hypothetical protein
MESDAAAPCKDAPVTARGSRSFWLVIALPVATAPASGASWDAQSKPTTPSAARSGPVPRVTGIVHTVKPHAVIVRRSDGTLVRVPVGPATVVTVNLARASLDAVRPGYIVTTGFGRNVLIALHPSGNYGALSAPGTVTAVLARSVVVANWHEETIEIYVARGTRVFLQGKPAAITDIAPGYRLLNVAAYPRGQIARVLRFKYRG